MSNDQVISPNQITASWLNSLSESQRAEFLRGEWARGMQKWAASHTAFFRWTRRTLLGTLKVNSGSVFFLQLHDRLLAVTAAHVYEGYLADKKKAPRHILCHIGNVPFDPEARLVGLGSGKTIDIATFWITWDELRAIDKQPVDGSDWPPPIPTAGQAVFLSGFPGAIRFWTGNRAFSFAIYSGLNKVDQINDQYVTCVLDRAFWVGIKGERLPPELSDIGGLSGGPLLLPQETKNGEWRLTLAAVISNGAFGSIVHATRAHFIQEDGSIIGRVTPDD
jgi:hypothetical protein